MYVVYVCIRFLFAINLIFYVFQQILKLINSPATRKVGRNDSFRSAGQCRNGSESSIKCTNRHTISPLLFSKWFLSPNIPLTRNLQCTMGRGIMRALITEDQWLEAQVRGLWKGEEANEKWGRVESSSDRWMHREKWCTPKLNSASLSLSCDSRETRSERQRVKGWTERFDRLDT